CTALFFVTLQHPLLLSLDFYGTVVIFSMSIVGFYGIHNWTSALRSVLTVVLSVALMIVTGILCLWEIFLCSIQYQKYKKPLKQGTDP
ncbi:hypothetical protein ACQJ18_28760, partial [Priestia megaterium]|uniref:hypothetical protein n=1 Tax=Priestia megaterium TaxID=1404 RepID=UPI003D06649F